MQSALAHELVSDTGGTGLNPNCRAAPPCPNHQRDELINIGQVALVQAALQEFPAAKRFIANAVICGPSHSKLSLEDFVAELDNILVMLCEGIIDKTEVALAVRLGVELEIVHHAIDSPVTQFLA